MLEIFRFLKGYVCFKIIGRYPERFINIITKSSLAIWNARRVDKTLCACMYIKDYLSIRYYAKKCKVRLKITSKHGLPFYIRKYKNRVGVLIGVAVFIAVLSFMSCFIWTIDVVGLETVSYTHLLEVLKNNGLYIGTFKPSVSFSTISRDTMLDIDDIGWMAVNVQGSHASVEIKEKAKSPQVPDYHKPANVKAKCDGLILSINTYEGNALFKSGSAVVKDQLLVSSVIEDKLGGVKLVRANAQVMAQTKRVQTFCVKKIIDQVSFGEKKQRSSVSVFNVTFPTSFAFANESKSLVRYHSKTFNLFDTVLPLHQNFTNIYEKTTEKTELNEKTAQKMLENNAMLFEGFVLSDAVVKNRDYVFSQKKDEYILTATFICEEDIAYQADIDADDITISDDLPNKSEDSQ
ncbi:MAG: hypothetical protein E7513_02260 [Ruminococcaceae bacterium]|nr:hypothetical protein [Oscillospiraceae bacterium]